MCKVEAHVCTCRCHTSGGTMNHVAPCCAGQCPGCKQPIRFEHEKEHKKECHAPTEDALGQDFM